MTSNTALAHAEDDTLAVILVWTQEVVEGRGESAAQMIVTVVLGCVPFVGQAIDAYNILRSLYNLVRDYENSDHWIELVLCLIALVPAVGDALKNVFRMLKGGKAMGRILDSLPHKARGNIEKWFRTLNWAQYTRELVQSTDNILAGLIDVLDTYAVEWLMGKQGVRRLVAQLKTLKTKAQRKITEAMDSMRQTHQRSLRDPLPAGSGHSPALPKPTKPPRPTPGTQAPATVKKTTTGTKTPASGQASGTQRQSQRSTQSRAKIGVSGEHIADYYYVRRQRSRQKVSHRGNLYEMKQPGGAMSLGHQGIDHVWHGNRLPNGYRVSDTKGTGGPFHKLETAKAVWQALEYGLDAYLGEEDEAKARGAVNSKSTKSGKQMSHRWIADRIDKCGLVSQHAALEMKVEAWRRSGFALGAETRRVEGQRQRVLVRCPYDRTLITVVGPNHNLHDKAKGATAGKCIKPGASHQIATEFVLPNTILLK